MKNSKNTWTDHTFNPWVGCTKVSPGCANCYAEAQDRRWRGDKTRWGEGVPRERTSEAYWRQPLRWNAEAAKSGIRPRVFCGSMCDWLDSEVPIEWLADLMALIHCTPNLDWLLLTKRPENWHKRLLDVMKCRGQIRISAEVWALLQTCVAWEAGRVVPSNVWLGATVENQEMADKRIPALLRIPAKVRFLSCEPLLGVVDLSKSYPDEFCVCSQCGHWAFHGVGSMMICTNCDCREEDERGDCKACGKGAMRDICPECEDNDWLAYYGNPRNFAEGYEVLPGINWVICGGESGAGARPMCPDWARSLRDQCANVKVPFLFKQWGGLRSGGARELDGVVHDGYPERERNA